MLLRTSKVGLGDVPDAERMAGQPAMCLHTQSSGPLSAHHKGVPEGFRGQQVHFLLSAACAFGALG